MLLAVINAKNVDQHDLIHLAVPVALLDRHDVVFTNAAANADYPPEFFTDPTALDCLDGTLSTRQNGAGTTTISISAWQKC